MLGVLFLPAPRNGLRDASPSSKPQGETERGAASGSGRRAKAHALSGCGAEKKKCGGPGKIAQINLTAGVFRNIIK